MTPKATQTLFEKLKRITIELQKIVILLGRQQNASFIGKADKKLNPEEARKEYSPLLEPLILKQEDASDGSWRMCNCGDHKHGELTGGWNCPVHGQQF